MVKSHLSEDNVLQTQQYCPVWFL